MRFLFFGMILILFSACQYLEDPPDTKADMNLLVLSNTTRWLKANKGLYACGVGGRERAKIEKINLSFFYYKSIDDLDQGRELLMSAVQRLIFEINKETRFHPHLYKCPFPPERIEIHIFVRNLDDSPLLPDQMIGVSFVNGVLEYDFRDKHTHRLVTIHKETYEEALAKLKAAGKKPWLEDSDNAKRIDSIGSASQCNGH